MNKNHNEQSKWNTVVWIFDSLIIFFGLLLLRGSSTSHRLFIVAYKFVQIGHIIYDDALIFQSIYSGNTIDWHLKWIFVIALRCRVFVQVAIAFAECGQLPQGQIFRFAMTHEDVKLLLVFREQKRNEINAPFSEIIGIVFGVWTMNVLDYCHRLNSQWWVPNVLCVHFLNTEHDWNPNHICNFEIKASRLLRKTLILKNVCSDCRALSS